MASKTDIMPTPPDNLGSRHRALNKKVTDAVANNIDFGIVTDEIEKSVVDKFYKIDLATKLKNVEYIIDVLKSGDSLYATRALKRSNWLFDDEYKHIINPEYLHSNIFPVTSVKVKIIILKTVALRVRREDRAAEFFKYCLQSEFPDIALKCLLFTSESCKLDFLRNRNKPPFNKIKKNLATITGKNIDYFRFIIGTSLTLFEAFLGMIDSLHTTILDKFRYLYDLNNVKYLELCEKYIKSEYLFYSHFDKQLSNDIMTKYKDRVLAKPLFYIEQIERETLLKNSAVDDIKVYITALLPTDADGFWASYFRLQYSDYLNVIPQSERYPFLKRIFGEKYPNEEFEMSKYFYIHHYYQYMTDEEREQWALNQIKSEKQVLGIGKDYLFYRFVNFKDAFEEIKNYVIVTKEAERRKGIIKTLIYSAKNNRELEILFKHYYRRHNNELREHKEYFLNKVIEHHNVFDFDEGCWNAFYTLLLSMDLYNTLDLKDFNKKYKNIALFYHILYKKDMPEGLNEYLLNEFYPYTEEHWTNNWFVCATASIMELLSKLTEEKRLYVYDFLFKFYTDKFIELKNEIYTPENSIKGNRYSEIVIKLMEINNPYTESTDSNKFKTFPVVTTPKVRMVDTSLSGRQLLRNLKKEKTLVMDMILQIKMRFENNPFNIDSFLKKISIYFPNDITNTFINAFEDVLTKEDMDQNSVNACVKAIFELGNENEIEGFMKQYAPKNIRIDLSAIDPLELRIQKAVCKYLCIARPSVPLKNILLYMKGDYVKYCVHVFNTYPAIVPSINCIELVKALVDAPVSIQKHALRLGFKCYDVLKVKEMSLNYWKNTKNVSVRCVIYKGLFNRLIKSNEKELYDALTHLTLDLHDTDQKVLFDLVQSNRLSNDYLGDFKEAAWSALSTFKDKQPNIQRKRHLLASIIDQIHLMKEEFIAQIVEEHVQLMLSEKHLYVCWSYDEIKSLYSEKWNLTVSYILYFTTTNNKINKYLETTQFIVKKCLEMWNDRYDEIRIYMEKFWEFLKDLKSRSLCPNNPLKYENSVPIFERILTTVQSTSPLIESYMPMWELQIEIINRKTLKRSRQRFGREIKPYIVNELLFTSGQKIGKVVLSMVNDKIYFISYSERVSNAITESMKQLLKAIYLKSDKDPEDIDMALVTLAAGLVEIEMFETFSLAVQLLPTENKICSSKEYGAVKDKIQKFSQEVHHSLHQKIHNCCN